MKLYNPAEQSKEVLIENFVVRTKIFEKIFKEIETSDMVYPEQHYFIQGQSGMGKTTFLLRLKYEIENNQNLQKWLLPVFFNAESYDVTTLSNLWEKILKYLDNEWKTYGKYYNLTDEYVETPDYERKCFELLIAILKEEKKKIIILFDNFGQLFLDNLSVKEQHRLREILMTCAELRIAGTSAIVLEDLYDYSKPFYEFFKIINLEGLTTDETFTLLEKLKSNESIRINLEQSKSKIQTLAILSGGVIRTIMLIYQSILADNDGSALQNLKIVLDLITPLYKHKIEDLPIQQRKIVDVIAKKWDAVSAKEIAESIRENGQMPATKLISAQLQQLEKNNIVIKKQTNTKNNFYQLNERFFNIWYLMRHGEQSDKNKVIWLTKYLEEYYNSNENIGNSILEIGYELPNMLGENVDTYYSTSEYEKQIKNDQNKKTIDTLNNSVNNDFENFLEHANNLVFDDNLIEGLNSILIHLMAKKQYHLAYQLFDNKDWNLKEKLKPTYYSLVHFMKNEFPNEFTRMGSELDKPVNDLIVSVLEFRKKYT